MKTRQDKTREWSKLTFFHNFQSTHALFSAWPFLLIHIQFTPSEGPEDFVNCFSCFFFLSNRTMEVGPSSQTMEKKEAIFHGPWCKPALNKRSHWVAHVHSISPHACQGCVTFGSPFMIAWQISTRLLSIPLLSRFRASEAKELYCFEEAAE